MATDINTKLANRTARADIIIGYAGRDGTSNNQHLGFRNDDIKSVANNFPAPPNFENTYFSCVDNTPRVRSGLLNKKIGDEERIKSLL